MKEDKFITMNRSIRRGNIDSIFKNTPIEINIQRHSIAKAFSYNDIGDRKSDSFGAEMVGYNPSVPMLADLVNNGDAFIFTDIDYAYIAYLIAELKAQAFIQYRKDLIIATAVTHAEIELIQRLDDLREYIYNDASVGYARYEKLSRKNIKTNTFISPFASTVSSVNNSSLIFKAYAPSLLGNTNPVESTTTGGWI